MVFHKNEVKVLSKANIVNFRVFGKEVQVFNGLCHAEAEGVAELDI